MSFRNAFVLLVFALGLAVGCKSKTEECMERSNENYARDVAKCADDACKQKAEKEKFSWYEACRALK